MFPEPLRDIEICRLGSQHPCFNSNVLTKHLQEHIKGRSSKQKAAQRNCYPYKYSLPRIVNTIRINRTDAKHFDKLETPRSFCSSRLPRKCGRQPLR
jgi:hypothetical protein